MARPPPPAARDARPDDAQPGWIAAHRRTWLSKRALREYYGREIFDRLAPHAAAEPVLEIGVGPGFLAARRPGMVGIDVSAHDGVSVCADAHRLPFRDGAFGSVVGVDVLHHLASPGAALAEASRVLRPGGRLALVEPWTGPVGTLFYRHLHHEDCVPLPDPWDRAFAAGKSPMDGNAWIPRAVLLDRPGMLERRAGGLRLETAEAFGAASYLMTGGFRRFGMPWPVVRAAARIEALLPRPVMRAVGLRMLYVLRKP